MDVKFEEVEERVVNGFERAIDVLFNAKVKLERSPCLVACHERNILELTLIICDMFSSINCPVQTTNGYCVPRRIAGLWFCLIWAGSFCERRYQEKKSRIDQPCAARAENCHSKRQLDFYGLICKETPKLSMGACVHITMTAPSLWYHR